MKVFFFQLFLSDHRFFVDCLMSRRCLIPSALGLALIHAYTLIDEGLVLPCVRAGIEREVTFNMG